MAFEKCGILLLSLLSLTFAINFDSGNGRNISLIVSCPSGWTSCGTGCCPLPSAVCCRDGLYCCPNGYNCGLSSCIKKFLYVPLLEKSKEEPDQTQKSALIKACPTGWTACGAGCCPLPSAVCCSDGLHCCPSGYYCDYIIGRCMKNGQHIPFYDRVSKEETVQKQEIALIKDCPSGWTECGAGCCPFPSAVCCSDGIHCCPSGYSCNYIIGGCVRNDHYAPFYDKVSKEEIVQKQKILLIKFCPSGWTTCGAGCCPLPSAVCCSDGLHCCPSGYYCDYVIGRCMRNGKHIPFYDRVSKEETAQKQEISMMKGCPSGWTECGAGCCPFPSAVCCSDGIHCCPSGYSCNYIIGGCVRNDHYAPFYDKVSKEEIVQKQKILLIKFCPSGWTTCGAGCCPLPSAICCSDGLHCCPSGYYCDYVIGRCMRNGKHIPFYDRVSKEETAQKQEISKMKGCPSGWTECGAGCCPFPSAVCCSDGIHCCPNGYSCNYIFGGCVRDDQYSPFHKKPKEIVQTQEYVPFCYKMSKEDIQKQ